MDNIDSGRIRSPFFPNTRSRTRKGPSRIGLPSLSRNDFSRKNEIDLKTENDVNVKINDSIKDFARIKKAVDSSESIDNSKKIELLKSKIKSGSYRINYDTLADKLLSSEY